MIGRRVTVAIVPAGRPSRAEGRPVRAGGRGVGESDDGGPDRIRTGDLQRDRLACWAATPRVRVAARAEHNRCIPPCRAFAAAGPHLYSAPMPDQLIDLRSDTVTKPSPAMRRAMAEAEVGDDVFGDDPTVNALEERAADLLGKEAGLFVASGTMGNLVAQMAHLRRGDETIAGREHHLVIDEAAGHAVIVGTSIRSLEDRPDGTMDLAGHRGRLPRPERRARAAQRAHHHREHPCPFDGPAAHPRVHPGGRRDRRRARHPAPHRRRPLLERRRRAARRRGDRARPGRPGHDGHVLPVQGPGLSGRLGRRRPARRHLARATCPQDGRRRHAPGRDPRRGRAGRAVGRPGRHDRPPRRGPRERPPAGRGPRRHGRHRVGRRHRPADARAPRPGPRPHRLRRVPRGARSRGLPGRPPSARRPDGGISARTGPCRDPLRRDRRRHRDHDRRHAAALHETDRRPIAPDPVTASA